MKNILGILLSILPFLFPTPTFAHAFGQQYTLPVPFWLYAYGAAGAVIASFVLIGFFVNEKNKNIAYPQIDISTWFIVRFATNKIVVGLLKLIGVFLFLLAIITGFFGTIIPTSNFNMTFFWIIFVLGITYVSAFIGNIYSVLNPWKTACEWYEKISGIDIKGMFVYPKQYGFLPALVFYFLFIWIELVGHETPFALSLILLIYSLFNVIGIYLFGKKVWFIYCEFFSVFFGLLSKIAIVEQTNKKFYLRLPFVGLLKENETHVSMVPFIVFMLSSTAFDGFRETLTWWNIYFTIARPFVMVLGDNAPQVMSTLGLLISFLAFLSLYFISLLLMKVLVRIDLSIKELALVFVRSLLPIALVYNIAHYYTLLVIQGQSIISLISDPLGRDWNIFGTRDFIPNIAIITTNTIWHSQVFFILLGHIAAVYIAHSIAIRIFFSHKKALISQFPMLILMVIYTVAGLWILSQPLTSGF